jgi:hypothetical protein
MKRAVIWAVVCGCAALAVLSCQKEAAPPTGAELEGAPPVGQELLPIVPELAYTPEEIWAMFDEVTFDEMHWDDVDLTQDNNLYYVPPSYDPEWPKVWQFILPAQTNLNPRSTTDDITIRIQTHDTVDPNKASSCWSSSGIQRTETSSPQSLSRRTTRPRCHLNPHPPTTSPTCTIWCAQARSRWS